MAFGLTDRAEGTRLRGLCKMGNAELMRGYCSGGAVGTATPWARSRSSSS
jgi:hypothetical protein